MRRVLLALGTFTAMLVAALIATVLSPAGAAAAGPAAVVDGIGFGHLPSVLGTASDFRYDYDDVDFVARVWESQTDVGWRVDLDIDVMRGARLTSGTALRDWFTDYEERDPEPSYVPVRVHGSPGWLAGDQLFWLVRPGLAVSVQLDGSRWSRGDVARAGWSAREVVPAGTAA